jgi:hypothetical protein
MDPNDFDWFSKIAEFVAAFADIFWVILSRLGSVLSDLQARYPQLFSPQTLFGLLGTTIAVWKWWEAREANLFRKFEEMIARNEAQLVKARNDLLDVMIRPGPGIRIRPPLFVESDLKHVLARRRWSPRSILRFGQRIDDRLESAVATSTCKVAAHLGRLSLYREEIASARIIQGTLSAARAGQVAELHERENLEVEAYDRFREVLALPGHREDVVALELVAAQLVHMEGEDQRAIDTYRNLIAILQRQSETPLRNIALARAKRGLAILRYPQSPIEAQTQINEGVALIMRLGPPRDRHMLALAEMVQLSGVAHLRLGATNQGPRQLRLAQTYYRNLLRSMRSRKRGLFRWMYESALYSGHRTNELITRAEAGLASTQHLLDLFGAKGKLLVRRLRQGRGVRRHNRKPSPLPKGH